MIMCIMKVKQENNPNINRIDVCLTSSKKHNLSPIHTNPCQRNSCQAEV